MFCVFIPLVARWPRLPDRRLPIGKKIAALMLAGLLSAPGQAAPPAQLIGSGVATVPADAAFFSSSLRLREQYERIVKSNAFAALRELPAVARALASWEEQQEMPGSPVSMFLTFLELPENEQAAELLADMVATDTFVYGTDSWVDFARLIRVVQRAQQAASLGRAAADSGFLEIEELEMIEEDDAEAAMFPPGIIPVRRQVELDLDARVGKGQSAAILEALAENPELIVVPDVVWGFKTSKQPIATFQIRRLEVLAKMLVDTNPDLAGSLARRTIPGGEIVTFTLDGGLVPWDDITADLEAQFADDDNLGPKLAAVIDRVRKLDLVVAIGLVGDYVVLSLGDSTDHLEQVILAGKGKAIVDTPAFAPLVEHAAMPLTGISFMSQRLVAALAASPDDLDPVLANLDKIAAAGGFSEQAAADARNWLNRAKQAYGERLPEPGAWTAFSFFGQTGYEGYVWNWSKNQPVDGSNRLDLLDHVGENPLAALVYRLKADPAVTDTVGGLLREGWKLLATYGRQQLDKEEQDNFDRFSQEIMPLGGSLLETVGTKLVAALADGQIGLVLDSQSTTRKIHADLPQAAEPLPLIEPAILLPLANRTLFVDGLNDVFEILDEFVVRLRTIDPDSIPAGYEIPAPVKQKLAAGTVWSFPLDKTGLDNQIQPAIVVGDDLAAFTLVPGQASRLLAKKPVVTAAPLAAFGEPAAGAAAIEWSRLVDAIEPWLVYLTRYGSVQQREGDVDPSLELTAGTETPEVSEALEHVRVVLEVARCLRAAAATTTENSGALVTHWQNEIRDLPAK
jgi:hypothetical protein